MSIDGIKPDWDDYEDNLYDNCPACSRSFDDIDHEYQSCSKCGWDVEKGKYNSKLKRSPTDVDYLAGDADILTGRWNY